VSEFDFVLFLVLVALGSAVQTVTGFALGLILMGSVTAFGLVDIVFSAAVVSLIALMNACIALRRQYRHIDYRTLAIMMVGLLPLTLIGLLLLNYLSVASADLLQMLLGVVVVLAGCLLMLNPTPYARPSAWVALVTTGAVAGLIGGMYGAGGAALAYLLYRQPVDINIVRATLLACFVVSSTTRTVLMTLSGHVNQEVLITTGLALPVVVVVTMVAGRLTHLVPEKIIRKLVFILLILMGSSLIFS
jgi:uncharacterized membrane protein YfcA